LQLAIRHTTHYAFSHPASHGLQRIRLRPKTTHGQEIIAWSMTLEGAREEVSYDDQHHNHVTLASVEADAKAVTITCEGVVKTADISGVIGRHAGHLPLWHFVQQTELTRPGPAMRELVNAVPTDATDGLERLHGLSRAVLDAVRYEIGHSSADTPAEDALVAGHGVCQDHAHIFIGAARLLGIPARYVSGYLMMNDRIDQEAGHGWAEAYVEGLGWVGFDVSNGISPDQRYVRVASGRDYREAAPVTGLYYGPGESSLNVSLAVEQQLVPQ